MAFACRRVNEPQEKSVQNYVNCCWNRQQFQDRVLNNFDVIAMLSKLGKEAVGRIKHRGPFVFYTNSENFNGKLTGHVISLPSCA